MLSIFTPSHDPKYLDEAYESLKKQTVSDWEWVVVLNGNAKWEKPKDERVVTYRLEGDRGVGYYKAEAVNFCTGDIFVELDHDDILLPTALEEIQKAFDENPDASLVFSDFAEIDENGNPRNVQFSEAYGWSYYDDGEYRVCKNFPSYPHVVSYIWYAPNHVRAFSKKAYAESGGYDRSKKVLDDQDLMSRLYLVGDFVSIDKNLYLQRVHGDNTQARQDVNQFIQEETVRMHGRTIQPLCLAWTERNGLLALDLGGAHNPAPGYKTVDMHSPADYLGDVFDVLASMEDNSVGVIRAVDFLEHIPDKIRIWNEMYRVLAHGGMILSMTPSTDGRGAFQDPTHNSFYNENSFWYFVDENYRRFVPELQMDFQVSDLYTYFPSEWHKEKNIPYVIANLIALKTDERLGGRLGV